MQNGESTESRLFDMPMNPNSDSLWIWIQIRQILGFVYSSLGLVLCGLVNIAELVMNGSYPAEEFRWRHTAERDWVIVTEWEWTSQQNWDISESTPATSTTHNTHTVNQRLTRGRTDHFSTQSSQSKMRHVVSCFHKNKIRQILTCIHSQKGNVFILWLWTLTCELCLQT